MKNTLAENMLRFGAKNLTESSKQKLERLSEQTPAAPQTIQVMAVTDKVDYINTPPTQGSIVTKPTIQFSNTNAPSLSFLGKADNNSNAVALSQDALIIPGKQALPHKQQNDIDFLYYVTSELFRNHRYVEDALAALMKVRTNLNKEPDGGIIIGTINNMLTTYQTYAKMPYPVFHYEIGKIKATEVDNDPIPWHTAVRKLFGLPTEDYQKYMQDGNYRQMVFNNWYRKNSTTPPPKSSPGEMVAPGKTPTIATTPSQTQTTTTAKK
jgi:hypothetical protein